jgi:magnesium-transporting ATPase (P-type)
MFISWDYKLTDTQTFISAKVQTSTLNEELGQVKFIFSDKTGTLTKNYMEFKKMSIGNFTYGQNDFDQEKIVRKDQYGQINNFNFYDEEFAEHLKNEKHENYENIRNYLICLCLCNTVFTEERADNEVVYQASSPDETALINAARYFNYKFLRREIGNKIVIEILGKIEEFVVTQIIEYSSERKRMSVVVKCSDGKIKVFMKGADSIVRQRISLNKDLVEATDAYLLNFAKDGLRTLMIAFKEISQSDYEIWEKEYIVT